MSSNVSLPLSDIWDHVYQSREWGKYPPEELVRFVARNFYGAPDRKTIKILEVGCGPGANIWYMAREGFSVYGLDWSLTALLKARKRLKGEKTKASFIRADMMQLPYPSHLFDAVIDISSIQHNRLLSVRKIYKEVHRVLKPGGKFFSMLIADGTWGTGKGKKLEEGTYTDVREGPFAGVGVVHFFKKEEAKSLLRIFSDTSIECSTRTYNGMKHEVKHWVVTAVC